MLTIFIKCRIIKSILRIMLDMVSDQSAGWRSEFHFPSGVGVFSSSPPRPDRGPPSLLSIWYLGGRGLSPRVKQPDFETDRLPPYIAQVNNTWNYNSTPPYFFMVLCLIKHRIRLHGMMLS
jgi:hypothetical protein